MNYVIEDFSFSTRANQNHTYSVILNTSKYNLYKVVQVDNDNIDDFYRLYNYRYMKIGKFERKFKRLSAHRVPIPKNGTSLYIVFHSTPLMRLMEENAKSFAIASYKKEKLIKADFMSKDATNDFINKFLTIFGNDKDAIKHVYYCNTKLKAKINKLSNLGGYMPISYSVTRGTTFQLAFTFSTREDMSTFQTLLKDILGDKDVTIYTTSDYGTNILKLNKVSYDVVDDCVYVTDCAKLEGNIKVRIEKVTINLSDSAEEAIDAATKLIKSQTL